MRLLESLIFYCPSVKRGVSSGKDIKESGEFSSSDAKKI